MMRFLKFDTLDEARERSEQAWHERIGRVPGPDETTHGWGWYQHPDKTYTLLVILDGTEQYLAAAEIAALLPEDHPDAYFVFDPGLP